MRVFKWIIEIRCRPFVLDRKSVEADARYTLKMQPG
jgi:hypothetical protein